MYNLFLNNIHIGVTKLEHADPSMGVVFGKIVFEQIAYGYNFFRQYCADNQVDVGCDFPEDRLISTRSIPGLIVKNKEGVEITGQHGISIEGMDEHGFEVTIWGVHSPPFAEEFPHHVQAYDDMFS